MPWKEMKSTLLWALLIGALTYGAVHAAFWALGSTRERSAAPSGPKGESGAVVALVNGKPIYQRDLVSGLGGDGASEEGAADDASGEDGEEWNAENRRLIVRIVAMLRADAIEAAHIVVSDEEIAAERAARFALMQVDPDVFSKTTEELKATRAALAAALSNPNEADAAYEKKLAPLGIPREQWDALRARYDTPEKLDRFWVPSRARALELASHAALRDGLRRAKLLDAIHGEPIAVSDEELNRALEKAGGGTETRLPEETHPSRAMLRHALLQRKRDCVEQAWVRRQCREGAVTIEAERFAKALAYLTQEEEQAPADSSMSAPADRS